MLIIKNSQKTTDVNSVAVAHELRNPLNNISLSCDQLKDELIDLNVNDDRIKEYLDIIKRNSNRLNQLISELFYSKDDDNSGIEEKSVINILEESLLLASDRLKLKKIKLEKIYHSGETAYFSEPDQIQMAFLNIIINAVESMEEGKGILKILTSYDDFCFKIKFCDNGIGIPQNVKEKLFHGQFSTKKDGLGIGLSISKKILEKANATIEVDSNEGEGTEFTICFRVN